MFSLKNKKMAFFVITAITISQISADYGIFQNFSRSTNQIIPDTEFQIRTPPITGAFDNNIEWEGIYHNSQEAYYRNPGFGTTSGFQKSGAVTVGTDVTLRLRTYHNDLSSAKVRIWDGAKGQADILTMSLLETIENYDYWEAKIESPSYPSDFYYRFDLYDGTDNDVYQDDNFDGGSGTMYDTPIENGDWGIIFYNPAFQTPDWNKNGIGYQIFPDRFFNGDPSNDPVGDGNSGDVTWWEWDSDGNGVLTDADSQRVHVLKQVWGNIPTRGGSEYYGGDFRGVINKKEYLEELGIDFIWFNPISESPDVHGYSVDDYLSINPYFGEIDSRLNGNVINNNARSLEIFDEMESELEEVGIKVIYDAVINHVSAQSKYFQRYEPTWVDNPYTSEDLGAYQSESSEYADWFDFSTFNHDYDAWWGFLNIPTLMYEQAGGEIEEELITGNSSLFTFWNDHNIDGFRLDVPNMYQDGNESRTVNTLIRDVVKANDPDDLIIGEIWGRANAWLTGTMFDSVQNMPFRDDTIHWLKNEGDDLEYSRKLIYAQENYPPEAFYSQWTILGNHDTARILTSLDEDKDLLKLASFIQFLYPGVPMIYYGDEVGLEGETDPDCRRTYPWGGEDFTLLEHYQKLIKARKNYPVLVEGGFEIIPDSYSGIITISREMSETTHTNALGIFNRIDAQVQMNLNVSSVEGISPGMTLTDIYNDQATYIVSDSLTINLILSAKSGILLVSDEVESVRIISGFSQVFSILSLVSIAVVIAQINRQRKD